MANELVATGSTAALNIAPPDRQLQLVARRPEEMQQAQLGLAAWYQQKIDSVRLEAHDALRNLELAKQAGIKADSFSRASRQADRRVVFYEKCLAAVEAGFAIVPDFPVDVFAIRVTRNIRRRAVIDEYRRAWFGDEAKDVAPAGQGGYVSPRPKTTTRLMPPKKNEAGREIKQFHHYTSDFDDAVPFPVAIAQPAVLEATKAALAMKLFDEVGCLPARRKPDPLVIGRIYRGADECVAFLIAWWVDSRTL